MILDERTEFADATAITTGIGRAAFGDVVDMGVAGRNIGDGRKLAVIFQITTAVTSAGAATVQFEVVSDAVAPPAADGTETLHGASDAIGKATLVAGYEFAVILPPEGDAYERYLGVQTVVGTAALTAGAANAFTTPDYASWKAFAAAI